MKPLQLILGSVVSFALIGCAGSSSSVAPPSATSLFTGTITVSNYNGAAPGVAQIAANVDSSGSIQGYMVGPPTMGPIPSVNGSFSINGSIGKVLDNGLPVQGVTERHEQPGQIAFTIHGSTGATTIATGTLTKQTGLALGKVASVPPSGTYNGNVYVMIGGAMKDFGPVYSSVDASGAWSATVYSAGGWIDSTVVAGVFSSNGTIPNLSYTAGGSVLVMQNPTSFSFDGTKLIVQADWPGIQPGATWLVMSK